MKIRLFGLVAAMAALVAALFINNAIARPSAMDITAEQVLSVTSATSGSTFVPRRNNASSLCQIEITGTATACVKGRASSNAPWAVLATRSVSSAVIVPAMPEMKVEVTSYTSGTVNAWFVVSAN